LVSSIWFFFRIEFHRAAGGTQAIGPHRANILEAIDRFGSISAAAPAVDLTFRQTWRVVQHLNALFAKPLVEIRRSGRSSGAFLTPLGKEVLTRFREMQSVISEALEPSFLAFEKITGINPNKPPPIPRFAQIIDPSTIAPRKKKPARRPKAGLKSPKQKAKKK
jgi:molybdate transport system regulatory protein